MHHLEGSTAYCKMERRDSPLRSRIHVCSGLQECFGDSGVGVTSVRYHMESCDSQCRLLALVHVSTVPNHGPHDIGVAVSRCGEQHCLAVDVLNVDARTGFEEGFDGP